MEIHAPHGPIASWRDDLKDVEIVLAKSGERKKQTGSAAIVEEQIGAQLAELYREAAKD